jgi:hypothetical protein
MLFFYTQYDLLKDFLELGQPLLKCQKHEIQAYKPL